MGVVTLAFSSFLSHFFNHFNQILLYALFVFIFNTFSLNKAEDDSTATHLLNILIWKYRWLVNLNRKWN